MQVTLIVFQGIVEVIQISMVFRFRIETRVTVINALDNVLRDSGQLEAGLARHDSPPCEQVLLINLVRPVSRHPSNTSILY